MKLMTLSTTALLLSIASASALDLSKPILDGDGQRFEDQFSSGKTGGKCGEPEQRPCLTPALAAYHALLLCSGAPFCPNEKPDGEEKYRRDKLATKISHSPDGAELNNDEAQLIRKLVGEMFPPLIVGSVWRALGTDK